MTASTAPLVVLVGPPGAGKTTVGRVLARRLGCSFTDVDALIEQRTGSSIAEIFTRDGEAAFREIEQVMVAEALAAVDGVLALGGGAVLAEPTRQRLRGHRVVHLSVGLADGLRRTGMSTARPLLAGVNPRATFRALLDARIPLYRDVATVEVDTVRRGASQVAREVLAALGLVPTGDVPADPADPAATGGPETSAGQGDAANAHPGGSRSPLDDPGVVLLPDPGRPGLGGSGGRR